MSEKQTLAIALDELNSIKAQYFLHRYSLASIIGDSEKEYVLGKAPKGSKQPKICRYCTRSSPEVKFKKRAHVLPEFLGNKNLLADFECDECNEIFSVYEHSMANFFGASRTFAQIKGKKNKVPKFKDQKQGLEISLGEHAVEMIFQSEKGDPIEIDEENSQLIITTTRQPYTPLHIPKLLIKIALAMLGDDEVADYEKLRCFILSNVDDPKVSGHVFFKLPMYFMPGPPVYPKPFAQLWKRKDTAASEHIPHRIVVLYYGNYTLQMALPSAKSDEHLIGQPGDIPIIPLLLDESWFNAYGRYSLEQLDFSSGERRVNEPHVILMHFDSHRRLL